MPRINNWYLRNRGTIALVVAVTAYYTMAHPWLNASPTKRHELSGNFPFQAGYSLRASARYQAKLCFMAQ